jgi:hypothetical protein
MNNANLPSPGNSFSVSVLLETVFSEYTVTFYEPGSGLVEAPSGYRESFRHHLNLGSLQSACRNKEELAPYLASYFWKQVNPRLASPQVELYEWPEITTAEFVEEAPTAEYPDYNWLEEEDERADYEDLEAHEITWLAGNSLEFDWLIHLFLLTEPGLARHSQTEQVLVRCATNRREAYLEHSDNWYYSERLAKLVKLALQEHRPYGFYYFFDDESNKLCPEVLSYPLDEIVQAPAREKMQARKQLREWLVTRGYDPASFGLENWEKIL